LDPKVRFSVLDGLRGAAAITVVAFHAGLQLHLRGLLIVKANVAVDFFFCLSGFVLAFAHDNQIRTGSLTTAQFLVNRLLRFFPVVLLGGCLAVAASYFDIYESPAIRDHMGVVFAFSMVLLPVPFESGLVWIVGVYWSLCIELIVNIAYGALRETANDRAIEATWAISCLVLIGCATWSHSAELNPLDPFFSISTLGGLSRGFTSFFAGVLVYRFWNSGIRSGKASPFTLIGIFAIPIFFPYSAGGFKAPLDLFFILIVFPFLVWVGASSAARNEKWLRMAGEASFPLYATHIPILMVVKRPFDEASITIKLLFVFIFTVAMFFIAVTIAEFYEKPARKFIRSLRLRLTSRPT
jgi:peptidoglycan/LPS O-acetylase OafA/YrhL